ncbi:hypothetical protein V500_03403 [Pseudogymnoascus sp. VKM F-4518 (FW-2643)]|nr:hypothetical protein V500_03403 [Pseudogymnoascus sp. VKM F-4518 (FW-2643)]
MNRPYQPCPSARRHCSSTLVNIIPRRRFAHEQARYEAVGRTGNHGTLTPTSLHGWPKYPPTEARQDYDIQAPPGHRLPSLPTMPCKSKRPRVTKLCSMTVAGPCFVSIFSCKSRRMRTHSRSWTVDEIPLYVEFRGLAGVLQAAASLGRIPRMATRQQGEVGRVLRVS